MRLPWSRGPKLPPPAAAPPTEYDRWMNIAAWGALILSVILFAVSILPVGLVWAESNNSADINITTEFYTAFDGGGGYITWDFSAAASNELRKRIDAAGNHDDFVSFQEFSSFQSGIDNAFTQEIHVLRNFEILAVKVVEGRGLANVAVNATELAHLKVILNGQWAQRDWEVTLANDGALTRVYGNLSGWERVRERTLIIAAGASTFSSYLADARVLRVPGGSIVAAGIDYTSASTGGELSPALHYGRFSFIDSTLILLVPMAIAYFVGVRAPRLEQEASRQRRVMPFHRMLSSIYWLLVVAYFAGSPSAVLWAAGVGFGISGLYLAFHFYPEEPTPDKLLTADDVGARPSNLKFDEEDASGAPPPDGAPPDAALELLDKAHGPLERPHDAAALPALPDPALAQAREMLSKAHTPLQLPDDDTPRPEGRVKAQGAPDVRVPAPPASVATPPALAVASGPPKTRVRCPGCKHYFEAEGKRPISVACPHCGRRGVLR